MGTQGDRLEQEARRVRARMTQTMEELRARITPGQMADQLADYARQGPAAQFIRNLGREVRENPLPLTLIAIGVAWLIVANGRSSRACAECFASPQAGHQAAREGLAADACRRASR